MRARRRAPACALATAVTLGWAASVWWPLWDDDRSAIALSVALIATAVVRWATMTGRRRQDAALGLLATALLAGWIVGDAVLDLAGAGPDTLGALCGAVVGEDLARKPLPGAGSTGWGEAREVEARGSHDEPQRLEFSDLARSVGGGGEACDKVAVLAYLRSGPS